MEIARDVTKSQIIQGLIEQILLSRAIGKWQMKEYMRSIFEKYEVLSGATIFSLLAKGFYFS